MENFKIHYPLLSVAIFVAVILVAHIFATNNYDWTNNTISDLGSQGYERKLLMQFGFLAFGITMTLGIMLNGLTWRILPILVYSLGVGLTGIFCTKPFFHTETYSLLQENLHSTFAQIAGIALTVGVLVQLFSSTTTTEKFVNLIFLLAIIGLSASFGLVQQYQGIVQRVLYLTSFIWLVKFYKPS
ncbi:MAG: DUF998 domain-containing protein [Candidatus Kapaibacterium sp.]|nr:MAG: DUF998 domain-containing protein [Candidatus Kapabacteria bacterium]